MNRIVTLFLALAFSGKASARLTTAQSEKIDERELPYYGDHQPGKYVATLSSAAEGFAMPAEDGPHEGTWLAWPHNFGWDPAHVKRYESMWTQMTVELHKGEMVFIAVFNDAEKTRVRNVLVKANVNMTKVKLYIIRTDDVWSRDSGPIFVRGDQGTSTQKTILDWRFNGWGYRADFWYDDQFPTRVGVYTRYPVEQVPMVLEGGSIEIDGKGTLMAKESCILNDNRNPGWTKADVEDYFNYYLGVTNFIWLPGDRNGYDITDDHIDGTARFANGNTIVTLKRADFWIAKEYDILINARNKEGRPYQMVHLPLTQKIVPGTVDFGIYVNYYVGNTVVLVPAYNDANDEVARRLMASVYPQKKVVSVNVQELYKDGGAIHCVTQQQPL